MVTMIAAVGEIERGDRAVLDARRAVADDVVELLLQLLEHPLDAVALQRVLVAGLRGREDVEIVVALVLDQRLVEVGVAVDDVDEVEDDAALAAHDQIEVAQPDVEIDDDGPVPAQRQSGGERGRARGFADPALARCDHHYFRQRSFLSPSARSGPDRAAGAWPLYFPARPERRATPITMASMPRSAVPLISGDGQRIVDQRDLHRASPDVPPAIAR